MNTKWGFFGSVGRSILINERVKGLQSLPIGNSSDVMMHLYYVFHIALPSNILLKRGSFDFEEGTIINNSQIFV